jgi:hypothetical protein
MLAVSATAGTVVPLSSFRALDLHGGGDVVLKHGPVQRVTILKGSLQYSELRVVNGTLDVSACASWWRCPPGYDFKVEIVTPMLSTVAVHGGGNLTTEGPFPQQDKLSLDIHGGGDADLRAIPVRNATVSVHGGGDLKLTATGALSGSVEGGGDVTYWGHPKQLAVATHGGGDISSGD